MIELATPGTSAVPLIPVAGDGIADEPDRLQCGQHREFEAPAATGSNRCVADFRRFQRLQRIGSDSCQQKC